MEIEGIHHHSVVVTDLERSRSFYREALGLKEVPIPPTFNFAVAWFALGDGQQLHLLHGAQADPPGARHIALHVRDARAARDEMRARGHRVEETTPIPGADRFFTADPDGNRIELIQWSTPWEATVRRLALSVR
jgi:glyoxylase I family protein